MRVGGLKLNKNMFISKVVGHSMEPKIPDGSYCIFRTDTISGTRQGKIVLVQSRQIHDPDTGGSYTVKKYSKSEKKQNRDGTWEHEKIILEPLNKNYRPIVLTTKDEGDFKVVAEFVEIV